MLPLNTWNKCRWDSHHPQAGRRCRGEEVHRYEVSYDRLKGDALLELFWFTIVFAPVDRFGSEKNVRGNGKE